MHSNDDVIGRGLAVDEDALAAALTANDIGGCAIDVFKKEPLSVESPLWECENAIITSHNASIVRPYRETHSMRASRARAATLAAFCVNC